jgi:hypothetical protein
MVVNGQHHKKSISLQQKVSTDHNQRRLPPELPKEQQPLPLATFIITKHNRSHSKAKEFLTATSKFALSHPTARGTHREERVLSLQAPTKECYPSRRQNKNSRFWKP